MSIKRLLEKIRLTLISNYSRESGAPYAKLDFLIERCINRMKVKPKCPYCGTVIMFRRSVITKDVPIRDDQTWKCSNCFHTAHFGVPITKQEYEEEFRLRNGRYLLTPTYRQDEKHRQDVLERLKQLGYLEFEA